MFTEMYWHRTTRAHEAVLATAVRRLRQVSDGFDDWFSGMALDPRTSDEWFLELCSKLASTSESKDLGLSTDRETRRIVANCSEMLSSLSYASGRKPFKRLISVSGSEDFTLYEALQAIRSLSIRQDEPLLETLSELIAKRIGDVFKQSVSPQDLVLDIPARRSSGNTVWVVSTSSPRRGFVARLSERSKMWKEFGDSFDQRTRKIRLYCPGALREKIRSSAHAGKNELKLYEIVREAALLIARDAVQLEIFGEPPPNAPAGS